MKAKPVVVRQTEKEVSTEILAESIRDIAEGMRRINASRLNRRGLLVLLKDSSGVSMSDIEKVLNNLSVLDRRYCK